MAKIYNPVGWEDGEIINPAIADLTTGIVTPAEVSGTTPVNAENLKHMDEAIKQLYDEGASSKDIYIGNDNPPEDTKIWVDTSEEGSGSVSEVTNSLAGNETYLAPSVQAVNNKFNELIKTGEISIQAKRGIYNPAVANIPDGYVFLCWLQPASNGSVNMSYISSTFESSTGLWVASGESDVYYTFICPYLVIKTGLPSNIS